MKEQVPYYFKNNENAPLPTRSEVENAIPILILNKAISLHSLRSILEETHDFKIFLLTLMKPTILLEMSCFEQ